MSKFADLIASLGVVRSERAKVERRLEESRQELGALRKAPLCRADALAALESYVDACNQRFAENLLLMLRRFNRDGVRTFAEVGGGLPLLRDATNGALDDRLLTAVLSEPLKIAIRAAMKSYTCPGTLPLAKREARSAELEAEVQELTRQLAEIETATDAARAQL